MQTSRADVVAEARKWIGTRWVHQGRSERGLDCAGLVITVGLALGLPAADLQGYKRSPDGVLFRKHIFDQTTFEPQPRFGSIGLFREAKFPTHTGIFGELDGQLTLIHSYMPYGRVIEEPFFRHDWPERLVAVRNYIGLID